MFKYEENELPQNNSEFDLKQEHLGFPKLFLSDQD